VRLEGLFKLKKFIHLIGSMNFKHSKHYPKILEERQLGRYVNRWDDDIKRNIRRMERETGDGSVAMEDVSYIQLLPTQQCSSVQNCVVPLSNYQLLTQYRMM
jgi:hypothetical protein